ncbi:MAG TPA: PfkB family carbohydrate kinase [Candidatus Brocadiia bacterium]|nr:PfkB family carbohydrate kinase [Candidatus Brocadiia bacterium]
MNNSQPKGYNPGRIPERSIQLERSMDHPATVADMPSNWLEDCLRAIPRARVTVFGDFCLDAYWLIDQDLSEVSVETGLPVRRVRRQRYSLGGAGNVVANLAALGVGRVHAVGVVGADLFGLQLRQLLNDLNVVSDGLLTQEEEWHTLVYAKPCIGGVEQNRLDFGGFNHLSAATADRLAGALASAAASSDVVVLNQQVPGGVSTPEMIERINRVVAAQPDCRFIVDSRHRTEMYKGCMLKLNAHEAARVLGETRPREARVSARDARDFARRLYEERRLPVFITRGENGILVQDGCGVTQVPGIQILERVDTVGCGDTALSAIAASLASGAAPVTAAMLANIAASITARKLQTTGTATPEEIRRVGPVPDYVYEPELADDPRRATHLQDTDIEIVCGRLPKGEIRHAIFDHDGTLSTLREGWEAIMEPMMVRAILGSHYATAGESLFHQVVDTVRAYIDKTTGVQTLAQMQGLVELVRRFGCVPENQVLDMRGYKALYNQQILERVRDRVRRLRRGELDTSDFEIKNARKWLETLHGLGVKLYLASGTDQADVAAEAEAMGYAHLFEGRIYGAVGDVKVEAKKLVIERIIREHGLKRGGLAVFGDGPVEMREARKAGAAAFGVASDELRRFGLNPVKRTRLIRAGADIIIPDFSQLEPLARIVQRVVGRHD